ncbi:MAG TPA: tetratricopeptide repeat protein [bacterium]|nr:tetratricopeptide repeat protein [bacterium]
MNTGADYVPSHPHRFRAALFAAAFCALAAAASAGSQTRWMREHPDVSWNYLRSWEARHQWLTPRREGRLLFQKERPEEARRALEEAVRQGAEDGETLYELGYCRRVLDGVGEGSLECFSRAASWFEVNDPAHPYFFNSLYLAGDTLSGQGNNREALARFEKAAELDPGNGTVLLRIALCRRRAGDPAGALRALENIAPEDEAAGPAAVLGAVMSIETGRPELAERFLSRVPADAETLYLRGRLLQDRGDRTEARRCYEQALEVDNGYREALISSANLAYAEGDLALARDRFRKLTEIEPETPRWHFNLGVVFSEMGKPEEAAEEWARAGGFDPEQREASRDAGIFEEARRLQETGQAEAAAELYRRILDDEPFFIAARYNLAISLAAAGDAGAALREYERLLRIDEDYAPAHLNFAILAEAKGMNRDAAYHFRRYLALEPESPQAELVKRRLRQLRGW